MIHFTCDRCDRPFEVTDDRKGEKMECPDCGDMNIVPGTPPAAAAEPAYDAKADRAADAGYPPNNGPETRVVRVHPALMRANPFLFLGVVFATLLGGAGITWFGIMGRSPTLFFWPSVALLVIALVFLGLWKIQKLSHSIEITTKRSIERRGLLSRATSEVLHENIRNIQITQTFLERLLNVGTLAIASAGQSGVEIQVQSLPGPDEIRKIIDLYRPL